MLTPSARAGQGPPRHAAVGTRRGGGGHGPRQAAGSDDGHRGPRRPPPRALLHSSRFECPPHGVGPAKPLANGRPTEAAPPPRSLRCPRGRTLWSTVPPSCLLPSHLPPLDVRPRQLRQHPSCTVALVTQPRWHPAPAQVPAVAEVATSPRGRPHKRGPLLLPPMRRRSVVVARPRRLVAHVAPVRGSGTSARSTSAAMPGSRRPRQATGPPRRRWMGHTPSGQPSARATAAAQKECLRAAGKRARGGDTRSRRPIEVVAASAGLATQSTGDPWCCWRPQHWGTLPWTGTAVAAGAAIPALAHGCPSPMPRRPGSHRRPCRCSTVQPGGLFTQPTGRGRELC